MSGTRRSSRTLSRTPQVDEESQLAASQLSSSTNPSTNAPKPAAPTTSGPLKEIIPDSKPGTHPTPPTPPFTTGISQHVSGAPSQIYYTPTLPRRHRSPSPDELIEARAQLDALRRTRREDELAEIRRQISELHEEKSFKTKDEGTDPRFLPLITRFSAIKPKFFRAILEDDFDPINITRLCNDVAVSRAQSKYIDLGKNLEVKLDDEDASESDIKGLAILIRCLGVYFQIKLHFAPDEKVRLLSAAFQKYEDHLCKLYSTYTWESIRSFHLNFHRMAINDGVDNPEHWSRIDTFLETVFIIQGKI